MTYHTPEGWASRCTYQDSALPHQIKLLTTTPMSSNLRLTCNCGQVDTLIHPSLPMDEMWRLFRAHLSTFPERD